MKSIGADGRILKRIALWGILLLLAIVCLSVLTWANLRFSEANPGGNDFLARWMGARFVLKGIQPYDDRVALAAQQWIYGHAADAGRGEDLSRFAYPLYAMIIFGPFAFFEFATARALWMTVLEISTVAFAFLTAALGKWQSQRGKIGLWLLFSILGYFGLRAIINGNPIVLVSLFLAVGIFLSEKGFPVPAGIVLAFATIKPQIAIFPILWIALWCLFQRRYVVIGSFGLTLMMLIGAGLLFVPNWILLNIREILDYPAYTEPGTPAAVLGLWFGETGRTAGSIISLLLLAALIWLWLRNRRGTYRVFLLMMGITISVAPLLGIPFDPGNEFLLLLPIALALSVWKESTWKNFTLWTLTVGALFFGLWAIFLFSLQQGIQPVQNPVMLFPLPVFLLVWYGIQWFANKRSLQTE